MDATELAAFLHSRRDRLRPADVGLAGGPRRRVPGLRREEVAFLANASIDYYIELERGRGVQPSAQMLLALARALRLTGDERDHLFHLAGHPAPPPREPSRETDPSLLALLERLDGTPARIMSDLHQPLAQNRLAAELLGEMDPVGEPSYTSSVVYRWFTDPSARAIYPAEDHERHAQSFVADTRATAARRALAGGDAEAEKMIADLLDRSEVFARLWEARDVAVRRFDRKRLVHPAIGVIELECHHLFTEDGGQRLLWLAPIEGTDAAEQLARLGG
ncbi:helix-turn-helix domain-containing protein [Glycomyces algeriensis]|uniref:DNA-binding protein n=1 Tax=Glycomyces algeriensis TaxID=256037 RepID=A0A9W6LGR0_9ACTN|nr:helix-turn-helix domain-containing protein [Glycomyces algeriensis]MDA1364514.1 helix-turn-helix domain-containing protein [Glycomyces algeriensis]MDR7350549.1 transcriptional regulator with XRE-family HTH domain [Glycomyces algeriensis]GLI43257.1 DNA-binding protein [Glycomyces algeriensis]